MTRIKIGTKLFEIEFDAPKLAGEPTEGNTSKAFVVRCSSIAKAAFKIADSKLPIKTVTSTVRK